MPPVRLRVPATFQLPDLDEVGGVDAVVPAPTTTGTTVVVDTDELELARWGVRLTHDGTAWRLELPAHPAGDTAAPTHHTLRASARTIPADARHALARLTGDGELTRVARLTVKRDGCGLLRDGELHLHVSDEEVSVHTGRRLTGRFREVVLQQPPGTSGEVLADVEAALLAAGALGRDDVARTVRILGPAAAAEPPLPTVPDGDDAGSAWAGALVEGLRHLVVTDVHLRLDDEGRSAAAAVRVCDVVLGHVQLLDGDAEVVAGLQQLRTLADEVDRHAQRLEVLGDAFGDDLPALLDRARDAVRRAVRTLHRHQDTDAHAAAIEGLRRLAVDPPLDADEAAGDARDSVARRLGKRWAPLAGALETGTPTHAAELAALGAVARIASGKAPKRFNRAARAAATAAADHHRATRVQQWLAEETAALDPAEAFRVGHLAGRRADAGDRALAAWDDALDDLTANRTLKWLR